VLFNKLARQRVVDVTRMHVDRLLPAVANANGDVEDAGRSVLRRRRFSSMRVDERRDVVGQFAHHAWCEAVLVDKILGQS
jgi:hypothetical protein